MQKSPAPDARWSVVGNLAAETKSYDALFSNISKAKDPLADFNTYREAHGLVQVVAPSSEVKGFPDRLEMDSPGGIIVGIFLKKLEVPAKSGLNFDTVYEVANVNSKKALREWNLPYGSNGPDGVDGNALFYKDTLMAICSERSYHATVRVDVDRSYELVKIDLPERTKQIAPGRCKAARHLFKDSAYATCSEIVDMKTKRKRVFVWQMPMT